MCNTGVNCVFLEQPTVCSIFSVLVLGPRPPVPTDKTIFIISSNFLDTCDPSPIRIDVYMKCARTLEGLVEWVKNGR